MNLYLDDDTTKAVLVARLRKAGHHVVLPITVGTAGIADPRHLVFAAQQNLVLVSHNYDDFLALHDLVRGTNGSHAGIFTIRADNDPTRDMKDRDIVRAIDKLERAGIPIANEFFVLNQWR